MATKKTAETAAAVSKKGSAQKKSTAPLKAIEGGKGKPASPAPEAQAQVLLRDGKTPANPVALKKALGVYGVAFKASATTEELLALVRKHLTKVLAPMKDEDKVKCTQVCNEVSTNDTDFCPYCGDEGSDAETTVEGDDPGAAEAAEAAATTPVAPSTKKGAKGAELAPAAAGGLEAAAKRLDESVERINSLRGDLAKNSYDLGVEIRRIHEEELWKVRGHESFKDFIEGDLDISRSMAYRLIQITQNYDRPTFEKVGSKKLALISGIQDSETRDAALEAAKAGASTAEVQRHKDSGKTKPAAPASSAKPTAAPAKKAANEITLLTKVGSKPQLVGFRSASSGRAIQHHKDDAYAELQIADEVKLRMAPKFDKDNNFLGISVAFVRVE